MDPRLIGQILTRCLGYRPGESVLVVTDTGRDGLGLSLYRGARDLGIDAILMTMEPRKGSMADPPPPMLQAFATSQIILLTTTQPIPRTAAFREAVARSSARVASFRGLEPDRLERLLNVDYEEMSRRMEDLSRRFAGAASVQIRTEAGTDLVFQPGPKGAASDLGTPAASRFFDFPAGEVSLDVREGSARGVVVVDGSLSAAGLLDAPLRLEFRDGALTAEGMEILRTLMPRLGDRPPSIVEIGFGMNPRAAVTGTPREDVKAVGTAHFLFGVEGEGSAAGGADGDLHGEGIPCGVLLAAGVSTDGRAVPRELLGISTRGTTRRRTRPAEETTAGPVLLDRDIFRFMFENANDAQYVIDLESQRFIEINPAFEKMTGYTRQELIDGQMPASGLIARESLSTYEVKLETRRQLMSDRYDLALLNKNGQKRPVEFSVKRVQLNGRDVVIGALRDLTESKQLEQQRREKILELGYANTRIYALTEKIRRIPELTPRLLDAASEEDLLRQASEVLCDRRGMAYRDVNIYLQQGDALELAFSSQGLKRRRIATDEADPIVRVFTGAVDRAVDPARALFPLKGREQTLGVLEVFFEPKEIQVLQGNPRAEKGYQDILEAVTEMMGLLLENLRLYETVRMQSIVDQLTGVYNRRFFDGKLADEVHRARRYSRALSVAMVDVDHFKEVNDTQGHKQGDEALTRLAVVLRANTRETDFICRYGGDEFAILMPETTAENALVKAEVLLQIMRSTDIPPVTPGGPPLRVTLSIGVADFQPEMKEDGDLLRAADEALYRAKRDGRNRTCAADVPVRGPKTS